VTFLSEKLLIPVLNVVPSIYTVSHSQGARGGSSEKVSGFQYQMCQDSVRFRNILERFLRGFSDSYEVLRGVEKLVDSGVCPVCIPCLTLF